MALVLLLALIGGVIAIGKALLGDDATLHTATTQPAGVAPLSTTGSGQSVPAGQAAQTTPATEPATEPTDEPSGVPTAAHPAKMLISGSSSAGIFGPYVKRQMAKTKVVETTLDYKVSSGLARPDFFDWPAHFEESVADVDPDIVVVTFGGNDGQNLTDVNKKIVARVTDTEKWKAEYGKRVGALMDMLSGEGRTLIWVGMPNGPTEKFTERAKVQDAVVKAEAAKRPDVVLIDTWKLFVGINGDWAEYVIDPRDGVGKDVRADDGFHLNSTGAQILSVYILRAITKDLKARGANL